MKKTFLLTTIFFIFCANAQNYDVVYSMKQVAKNINLTTNIKTYLKGNGETSIYVEDFRNSFQESDPSLGNINLPTENNPTYLKDTKNGTIMYNDHIQFKFFNIEDKIEKFDWKIETEVKEILGYQCQKATLKFRGRDFTVYFSHDIIIPDGPKKFFGLPGLILEIISDDSVASFHYLAQSITFPKEKIEIKNIYSDKNKISYADYIKLYNEKYIQSLSRIVNEKGETRPMAKGFMEVLINE